MTRAGPGAALRWEDARARIAAALVPVAGRESVALCDAAHRVLATDLVAPVDVPAHDNSAMDGFAVRADDGRATRRIVGRAFAGHPFERALGPGDCVRIMTGAVVPAGADAIVPIEQANGDDAWMTPTADVRAAQHVRRAGEDLRRGSVAIARGRRLTASDVGLAASVGARRLDVLRRPRIALFSTGDELRDVGQPLVAGAIHDSNRYVLAALLRSRGVDVIDLGVARDDAAALAALLDRALSDAVDADAIVTSGGVSAGDADHVRPLLASRGDVAFWSLAIKPGRPMAFGRLRAPGRPRVLFGLPGNPVAVVTVFHALLRDALDALAGATPAPLPLWRVVCDTPLPKAPGRTEFVRGIASPGPDGWRVRPTADQGSGILRSISEANCLIVLPHDRGPVAAGEIVDAWPLEGLA